MGGRGASKTSAASRSQILPSLHAPCRAQVFLVHFKGYLETTHLSRNLRGSRQPGVASRSTPFDETFIFFGLKVLYHFPHPMTVLFPNTTPTREASHSERLSIPGREPGILPGRSLVLTAPHEGRSPVIVTGKVQCRWLGHVPSMAQGAGAVPRRPHVTAAPGRCWAEMPEGHRAHDRCSGKSEPILRTGDCHVALGTSRRPPSWCPV